jgi:hypothetical protein
MSTFFPLGKPAVEAPAAFPLPLKADLRLTHREILPSEYFFPLKIVARFR